MAEQESLPLTLLTGFLGSGKTSLLKRALADPAWSETAVLINELGEIGLDHYLVDTVDGPVLELPGGCLCCAIREDLAASLRSLLERRSAGALPPFRRIAIETTGLADPAPILFTLGADAFLDAQLHLERVVTTVDAVAGEATLARFSEAARQVAVADRLVLTKTDLAPPSEALHRALTALNPEAAADISGPEAGLLFGAARAKRPGPPPEPTAAHSHGIASFALTLERPCSRLDFARALGALARDRGEDLLRVKGIVGFSDRPERPAFVQGAQHALYPPVWLDAWPDGDRRSRLQFIVQGIALDEVVERFACAAAVPVGAAHRTEDEPCSI